MDDLKSSHKDPKVNDQFNKSLQDNYGAHREVMIHWGRIHEYLGMEIDYGMEGKVKIGMIKYVENMLKDFTEKMKSTDSATTPASNGVGGT
jgi:hypothetical protein